MVFLSEHLLNDDVSQRDVIIAKSRPLRVSMNATPINGCITLPARASAGMAGDFDSPRELLRATRHRWAIPKRPLWWYPSKCGGPRPLGHSRPQYICRAAAGYCGWRIQLRSPGRRSGTRDPERVVCKNRPPPAAQWHSPMMTTGWCWKALTMPFTASSGFGASGLACGTVLIAGKDTRTTMKANR